MKSWDQYFIDLAHSVKSKAKDTTQVGCVLVGEDQEVLSTGWNGFSRGINETPERMKRPEKYHWTIHAEANAICNAAKAGTRLKGASAYVTHMPCEHCIDLLIQSGIKCIVVESVDDFHNPEIYGFDITKIKAEESGIELRFYKRTEIE
ncbi:deoxycytidylate deaminase [Ochrobactrum phage vB_OspM_OC]|nr:deoxycytidylate deaminase [Ochrobactrum phage vB_OspM_OC]